MLFTMPNKKLPYKKSNYKKKHNITKHPYIECIEAEIQQLQIKLVSSV